MKVILMKENGIGMFTQENYQEILVQLSEVKALKI
jgi:hypothetical protein